MQETLYHPDLETVSFMLGRHGQSVRNAGDLAQGSGEEMPGMPPNILTPTGHEQARASYAALHAADITVQHVNSSELPRARQSAETFVLAHHEPKPSLALVPVQGIKEVSQAGWSAMYDRKEVKALRDNALKAEVKALREHGLEGDLAEHAAWTMRLGDAGETPLQAALRGITALETYGVKPGELIFSHAMLNRYMDAIATRTTSAERAHLVQLLEDGSAVGKIATLQALKDMGIPMFDFADDKRNQQANGGVTEYTVEVATGKWRAGRRIEPPKKHEVGIHAYVEHERNEEGMWNRTTPVIEEAAPHSTNNE